MRHRIAAGIGAGLVAGVILAVLMRILPTSASDGSHVTMTAYAARLIHAGSPWAGWLVYLAYAVVVGALYGAASFVGRTDGLRAAILGGAWGLGWFALIGFGAVPALLGDWPLSAAALHEMRNIGGPLLIGHIVYGLVLGSGFNLILGARTRPKSSGHAQPGMKRAA